MHNGLLTAKGGGACTNVPLATPLITTKIYSLLLWSVFHLSAEFCEHMLIVLSNLANKQTNKQTNKQWKHNLLDGDNWRSYIAFIVVIRAFMLCSDNGAGQGISLLRQRTPAGAGSATSVSAGRRRSLLTTTESAGGSSEGRAGEGHAPCREFFL